MAEVNVEFAKHKHLVILSPRAYGDLDYKQRKNWNSRKRLQRERANLLFNRVNQGLYNLANDIEPTTILPTSVANEYVYQLSDGIGRIVFKLINSTTDSIIYVLDFIWDYKTIPNSWWSIVENEKHINQIITETINNYLRRNIITSSH